MPKAKCINCQIHVPVQLLSLHVKECQQTVSVCTNAIPWFLSVYAFKDSNGFKTLCNCYFFPPHQDSDLDCENISDKSEVIKVAYY